MSNEPRPPKKHVAFANRFPEIARAWQEIGEAGRRGPLDPRTVLLVKLGISIGTLREGAVHSAVRKALAAGVAREEIEQVLALASSTVGMPATVAAFTWIADYLDPGSEPKAG